jgi:CheY-like chemotaxis protein
MRPGTLILLIENDPTAREAMRTLLQAEGYRVACAANGREALNLLERAEPPDLIVLDLSMPVMDGQTFRLHQRHAPAWAPIPVIVVSGEDDLPQQAASLGASAYHPKPVDFHSLLDTIRDVG